MKTKKNHEKKGLELSNLEKEESRPETVQAPAVNSVDKSLFGRVSCFNLTPLFYLSMLVNVLLIAGGSYLLVLYNNNSMSRPIVIFSFVLTVGPVLVFQYCLRQLWQGCRGKLERLPFERPKNPQACFELGINGKYYLWRSFLVENFELFYQLFNYSFYACSMSSGYLISYSVSIALECAGRAWNRWNTEKQITMKEKSMELLFDLFVDLFTLLYPLLVMNFETDLPFRDNDLIFIITSPVIFLLLKIKMITEEELAKIVYADLERVRNLAKGITGEKERKRRRSSMNLRENGVRSVQNATCSRPLKRLVLTLSIFWCAFFSLLAFVQVINIYFIPSNQESSNYLAYCALKTPSCDRWFGYKENCFYIKHMSTTRYNDMDAVMKTFQDSTATQIVEMSFLNDTKAVFPRNSFPRLRRLILYKPLAKQMVSLDQWPELILFGLYHAPNLETIEGCCGPSVKATILNLENAPKLKLEELNMPELGSLYASELQLPATINLPKVQSLHLRDMNLTKFPASLDGKVYQRLNVAGNRLSSLKASANFIVDIRYNKLQDYKNKARYSYAHKNTVCPDGFDCSPFCHPKCKNKYYYPDKMSENYCTIQCVEFCPMSKGCAKLFERL